MSQIIIEPVNELYIKVRGEDSAEKEIHGEFKFEVDKAKFLKRKGGNNRFKNWDGSIHLYNLRTKQIYAGLKQPVIDFCKEAGYEVIDNTIDETIKLTDSFYNEFVNSLELGKYVPRDYQKEAFLECVENNKALIVSPTSSGKSLIIYMVAKFYLALEPSNKILIIVPGTILLEQMASDFRDYGYTDDIHIVKAGREKSNDAPITISTWQSLTELDKQYFKQYTAVFFDEAHTVTAKSLTAIMDNLTGCKHRFGFTGTLKSEVVNRLTLEGMFAPAKQFIKTHELMERKEIADLDIKIICFDYNDQTRKNMAGATYQEEIDFIISNERRNKFIVKLAKNLEGNTLILCSRVDQHAKILYDMFVADGCKVYYIVGDIDDATREKIRKTMEKETNAILIASYGTLSQGVSIINLHNVIFATAYKTNIKTLQSIGRVLRKSIEKLYACLYDLGDDFSYKGKINFCLGHLYERVKIYDSEQFKYSLHRYKFK